MTQRTLADYLVDRDAHYHFTLKGNQATLDRDIALHFDRRGAADARTRPHRNPAYLVQHGAE